VKTRVTRISTPETGTAHALLKTINMDMRIPSSGDLKLAGEINRIKSVTSGMHQHLYCNTSQDARDCNSDQQHDRSDAHVEDH
jgi:hypothetical protein